MIFPHNYPAKIVELDQVSMFEKYSADLQAAIESVKVPSQLVEDLQHEKGTRLIRDKLFGLFKITDIVNSLLQFNDGVEKDIREKKKEALFAYYFEKCKQNDNAVSTIRNLLTSPYGFILFNKIIKITDDNPVDMELTNHLATALAYICRSNFNELFDQHKYSLSIIEQLSPQALTILSDHLNWPLANKPSITMSSGSKVTSDWLEAFTLSYSNSKGIHDIQNRERLMHSISGLIREQLIEAHLVDNDRIKCTLTSIGMGIAQYINP